MVARIKKGDEVIVITGKDKGKKGEVITMLPKSGKAIVRGINIVKRHTKPTQEQEGGIVEKELPIQLSNIACIDPKDGKAVRVGVKTLENGNKVRYAKRSGELLDN